MKLLAIVWHTIVYNNASITFHGSHMSPTAIFGNIKICSPRIPDILLLIDSTGHVAVSYILITAHACTYMFMLEFQLVIPYHNRHTHCPRLFPYVMSDLEMVYIQHGTVLDIHI